MSEIVDADNVGVAKSDVDLLQLVANADVRFESLTTTRNDHVIVHVKGEVIDGDVE
jgi:hypothetical protein